MPRAAVWPPATYRRCLRVDALSTVLRCASRLLCFAGSGWQPRFRAAAPARAPAPHRDSAHSVAMFRRSAAGRKRRQDCRRHTEGSIWDDLHSGQGGAMNRRELIDAIFDEIQRIFGFENYPTTVEEHE